MHRESTKKLLIIKMKVALMSAPPSANQAEPTQRAPCLVSLAWQPAKGHWAHRLCDARGHPAAGADSEALPAQSLPIKQTDPGRRPRLAVRLSLLAGCLMLPVGVSESTALALKVRHAHNCPQSSLSGGEGCPLRGEYSH